MTPKSSCSIHSGSGCHTGFNQSFHHQNVAIVYLNDTIQILDYSHCDICSMKIDRQLLQFLCSKIFKTLRECGHGKCACWIVLIHPMLSLSTVCFSLSESHSAGQQVDAITIMRTAGRVLQLGSRLALPKLNWIKTPWQNLKI